METIPSNQKDKFIKAIKDLSAIVVGLVGAVATVVNFIHIWNGDQETVTYVILGFGIAFIVFTLSWFGFRRKKSGIYDARGQFKQINSPYYPRVFVWARLIIFLLVLCIAGAGYSLYNQRQVLESKIIILVTNIDGPEPKNYRVTEELLTLLRKDLLNYDDTVIMSVPESITEQQGSIYARNVGKQHTADIVLWGWYGFTNSNVLLTLNVENLNNKEFSDLDSSKTLQFQKNITQLDSFAIQQNISGQMKALIYFMQGLTRVKALDYKSATLCFDNALNSQDWNDELINKKMAFYWRGYTYSKQGNPTQAIDNYSQVLLIDPNNTSTLNNRGVAYNDIGEYDKAIIDTTKAIQLDPKDKDAYNNRAIAFDMKGEYTKAIDDATFAIKLDSTFAEPYVNRGITFGKEGEYDKAIADFNISIKLRPNNIIGYINRGFASRKEGEYDKAIADYTKAIKIDPNLITGYEHRAEAYVQKEDYQNAIADYTHAIQLGENDKSVYFSRADAYFFSKNYAEAVMDYSQVLRLDAKNTGAYINRGIAYENMGEIDKAINDYSQAIIIDPNFATAYFNRGGVYENKGEFDKAIEDFTKTIQLDPKYSLAILARGNTYSREGDYTKAIIDYTQVIQEDPNNVRAFINRGKAFIKVGEYESAIKDLEYAGKETQDPQVQKEIEKAVKEIPQPTLKP